MRKRYFIPLCATIAILAGCDKSGLTADEREERDPLVKTGVAYMEQNQWDDAEQTFKEALDNDPRMAKPHLDLALLYQQYKPNYIHAIYHYDRYLELRPESEKADFIREQRDKVMRAIVVQAVQQSPEVQQVVAEVKRLQQENAALKKKLAKAVSSTKPVETTTATPRAPATTVQPAASTPSASPATPSGKHQIYTVVAGDNLSKIATKFYGDSSHSDIIFDANRDSLSNPNSLRVGQTLVIPLLN